MTTTSVAKRVLTPDPAEVAEFRRQFTGRPDSLYPFVAGYLTSIVQGLARENSCRKPDCLTCDRLRRGLALIAAITTVETDKPAGDAS